MLAIAASLAGMALTGLAAYGLGRRAFPGVLPWPLAVASGAAILSLVIFGLLLAHVAKPVAFVALAVLAAGLALHGQKTVPLSRLGTGAMLATLPFALLYLVTALSPEIQPDSLHYHLNLPMEARETGGFPKGISFYEVMPQGLETLFTMAYAIGRDPAAKLFHLLLLAATIPLMRLTAQLLGYDDATSRWAALFYAVTPVVGAAATCTYNDAALAFFVLSTFALTLLARKEQRSDLAAAAGLCGGFCYAIKFTGAIPAAAFFLLLATTRRWDFLWRYALGAALVAAPWIARSYWLTGNPVAPLANRLFPNPWFHIETEQKLAEYLRGYGGLSWAEIPRELTLSGEVLQGFLGPLWLLAPAALLVLGKPAGRIAWLGIGAGLAPWLLNLGTRFTMPALPLLALSLFQVLPRRAAPAVALLHAVLSWPSVVPLYSLPDAWRIREIPWRAALRLEKPDDYRKRTSMEWNLAAMIQHYTPPGQPVLDLADAPLAASRRPMVNNWQTALGDRLLHSLRLGLISGAGTLFEWKSKLSSQAIAGIRITAKQPTQSTWAVQEIWLQGSNADPSWTFSATANPAEAPLAMDGLLTTYWSPWDSGPAGTSLEALLPAPTVIAQARILTADSTPIRIEILESGAWREVAVEGPGTPPALNLRLDSMRAVKRAGLGYVLARAGNDTLGLIGASMAEAPSTWGLEMLGRYEYFTLYRLVER